ncbi:MAG TPA: hypothetical protein DCM40_08945 [Maribacter sp.]|jgi:hypothetical protein|nr:hypothetical protein [Maribacter sp.]
MAKSSKFKQLIKDYAKSIGVGSVVFIGLFAMVTSLHFILIMLGLCFMLVSVLYIIGVFND